MGLTETLVFYLVVGLVVSVASFLSDDGGTHSQSAWRVASAIPFWPLYLPILLTSRGRPQSEKLPADTAIDEMARATLQVERELDSALSSLDGWAEDALASEAGRIAELRHALAAQAQRIREMDELLAHIEPCNIEPPAGEASGTRPHDDALARWQRSQHAWSQNLARLTQVRRQAHADLMGTLAWIRELVSMIHLAKFTGAPPARAEELVAQIAAAVEGVSEVAWSEPGAPEDPCEPQALTTAR